ncbi:peptide-methionine (S)-S-oxide reductase [Algibacter sp.]|uniref:peptide-methionine (S)-S-oxide reductase n=1 Tax=Algibacter sp. TaxID=1872428 RepID=UPI003C778A16
MLNKIALGGGCHWCTEAVFQSLVGVSKVEQGFVASTGENIAFSEAVIVHFNTEIISLKTLIEIHLHTHKSSSNHSMRTKYRSAVYTFSKVQKHEVEGLMNAFQDAFENKLITQVFPFKSFKASRKQIQNYYYSNPKKPFCQSFINPKLEIIINQFSKYGNENKLKHLKYE